MTMVPDDFLVPDRVSINGFFLRKLSFSDTDTDYKAVLANLDIIQKTRGGSWPTAELTYEEDQIDLAWHQREFEYRYSFAYVVFSNMDEKEYIGCVYLYEPNFRGVAPETADVDVSFWVTQEAYNKGLYEKLYETVVEFLKNWPFKSPSYTNIVLPSN